MTRADFARFNAGVRRSLDTSHLTASELFFKFPVRNETPVETTRRLHAPDVDGVCPECLSRESGPDPYRLCGTPAGRVRHRTRGEEACPPCVEADRAYRRNWYAANRHGP